MRNRWRCGCGGKALQGILVRAELVEARATGDVLCGTPFGQHKANGEAEEAAWGKRGGLADPVARA